MPPHHCVVMLPAVSSTGQGIAIPVETIHVMKQLLASTPELEFYYSRPMCTISPLTPKMCPAYYGAGDARGSTSTCGQPNTGGQGSCNTSVAPAVPRKNFKRAAGRFTNSKHSG